MAPPVWELKSTNIGEPDSRYTYTGEGYVLHSTGSSGDSDISIYILPIIQYAGNDDYWCVGAEMGVSEMEWSRHIKKRVLPSF